MILSSPTNTLSKGTLFLVKGENQKIIDQIQSAATYFQQTFNTKPKWLHGNSSLVYKLINRNISGMLLVTDDDIPKNHLWIPHAPAKS